jgi:transposase-like protein
MESICWMSGSRSLASAGASISRRGGPGPGGPRTRPRYPPEFRRQAVELIRSGTPLRQVADELGVSEQTLRN